ncbi:MAG: hypothetical protein ISS93_02265 [Candidatus Aenigmarchaeota archaeon]|nr:hypothetical protein [Candidatus Aenigmarchaeota archaeon]
MRDFGYFVSKGDVKKVSKDIALARSLMEAAKDRLAFAKSQPANERAARFVLEEAYEAVREALDAKLALDGYKSYSHEAPIAYIKNKGLSEGEAHAINHFRFLKNRTKYYGKRVSVADSREAVSMAEKMLPKIERICFPQKGGAA